jgi:hypothetical protein
MADRRTFCRVRHECPTFEEYETTEDALCVRGNHHSLRKRAHVA